MTEQEPESHPDQRELAHEDAPVHAADSPSQEPAPAEPADPPATGVPGVDAALAEVDGVEAMPLEEQLAAFERAHDQLRSALDSEPGDPA